MKNKKVSSKKHIRGMKMTISVGLYPIIFLYRNIGTEYG